MLCWNKALSLGVWSQMTIFNQSECIISVLCSYNLLKVVFDDESWLASLTLVKFLHMLPNSFSQLKRPLNVSYLKTYWRSPTTSRRRGTSTEPMPSQFYSIRPFLQVCLSSRDQYCWTKDVFWCERYLDSWARVEASNIFTILQVAK